MMNLVFVTSHHKTALFYEISCHLEQKGHQIFWVSSSHYWALWLEEKGVPKNKILNITLFSEYWNRAKGLSPAKLQELHQLEKASGWSINDLILMDRYLPKKSKPEALAYLFISQSKLKEFFKAHQIQASFCEKTFAFELMVAQVCQFLKIECYSPHTIRIPDQRFAFFKGHLQEKIEAIRLPTNEHVQKALSFYEQFKQKKPKPKYFYLHGKGPKFKWQWLKKIFSHLKLKKQDPHDLLRPSLVHLIKNKTREIYHSKRLTYANIFETPLMPPNTPFVFLTLHKQPESSVDVLSSYFSNQLETIKAIARGLPVTHQLYVKEHPCSIGEKTIQFFKQLQVIPSVRVIHPNFDSFELLQYADLTISMTGTVCYEAALMKKKAVTAVPMFFSPLLSRSSFNPYQETVGDILEEIKKADRDLNPEQKIVDFLAWIYANSFEGDVGTPSADNSVSNPANILKVNKGFSTLVEKLQEKHGKETNLKRVI